MQLIMQCWNHLIMYTLLTFGMDMLYWSGNHQLLFLSAPLLPTMSHPTVVLVPLSQTQQLPAVLSHNSLLSSCSLCVLTLYMSRVWFVVTLFRGQAALLRSYFQVLFLTTKQDLHISYRKLTLQYSIFLLWVFIHYFAEDQPRFVKQQHPNVYIFETDAHGNQLDLILPCPVVDLLLVTFTWFREDQQLPQDMMDPYGNLTIFNITEGEYASRSGVEYYCVATKIIGRNYSYAASVRSRSISVFYACKLLAVTYSYISINYFFLT